MPGSGNTGTYASPAEPSLNLPPSGNCSAVIGQQGQGGGRDRTTKCASKGFWMDMCRTFSPNQRNSREFGLEVEYASTLRETRVGVDVVERPALPQ